MDSPKAQSPNFAGKSFVKMTSIHSSDDLKHAIQSGGPEHDPLPKPPAYFIIKNVGTKKVCTSGQSSQTLQDRPICAQEEIKGVGGCADPSQMV